MEDKSHIIPAVAVRSIASGLLMMAIFTLMWTGIAFGSLYPAKSWYALLIFPLFSILFVVNAVRLFSISKYFPKLTSEADIAEGKRSGKWFGIIFGAEGLGIFIAVNTVIYLGHADLTIPVIALVVGLHFYPMAKLFKRTFDYYLATWSTLIAVIGIMLILKKVYPFETVDAFVGIGLAIATSCYGVYMMMRGRKIAKPVPMPS
jgi:hypothetical protein